MARAIWIGAVTGARPGEIRALRISDFHAEEGRLGVERAISDGQVWATKNRQIRDNHLDDVTTAVVTQQIEFLHARAAELRVEVESDAYLFTDDVAGRTYWRSELITNWFARLRTEAGIEGYAFKHLRKFMDTYGQVLGFSREEVAMRAGHDPLVAWQAYTGQDVDKDRALSGALAQRLVELEGAVSVGDVLMDN